MVYIGGGGAEHCGGDLMNIVPLLCLMIISMFVLSMGGRKHDD